MAADDKSRIRIQDVTDGADRVQVLVVPGTKYEVLPGGGTAVLREVPPGKHALHGNELGWFRQAGFNVSQLYPEHFLHMFQGKVMRLFIEGGYTVDRYFHIITADFSIGYGI